MLNTSNCLLQAEAKRAEKERFERDPEEFIANLLERKEAISSRRKERMKLREQLQDKRSAAAKSRMRLLAEMGTHIHIQHQE